MSKIYGTIGTQNAYAIAWVVLIYISEYVVVLSKRDKPTHAFFMVMREVSWEWNY